MSGIELKTPTAQLAHSFYPNMQRVTKDDKRLSKSEFSEWFHRKLKVVVSNALTKNQSSFAKNVLKSAAESCGMTIGFENEDRSSPGWKERLDDLKDMDIRVVRVDIGGSYEPWVVRMMFCSRLGVSFPDPSGNICKLTENMNDRSNDTAEKFEKVVYDDAAVNPLFHSAFSWIVSDDLGMDRFSPTANLIRFEAVQIK
jgi:hypothetical protein